MGKVLSGRSPRVVHPVFNQRIENRLWAEINIDPDFPTSQEYLPTDPAHPFYGAHRVFAWNSFVFQALQLAGSRSEGTDPAAQR